MTSFGEDLLFPISSLILITAFYMQGQEFIRPMIRGQLVQSILLAVISVIMGIITGDPDFIILAALIVVLRGFLITFFLERGIRKDQVHLHEKHVSVAYPFLISLVFVLTAVLIVYSVVFSSIKTEPITGNQGILVFPLALFFQGLFLIASRRTTYAQIMGYIEEENAIVLFAVFLLPVPLLIDASVFLDVLALVVISSVVVVEKFTHERVEELRG